MLTRKLDCGRHIGWAGTARDHGRVSIDHVIPDAACLFVSFLPGNQQRSAQTSAQVGDGRLRNESSRR